MNKNRIIEFPYRPLAWTVCGLLVLILATAGWRYAIKPSVSEQTNVESKYLDEAVKRFNSRQQQLLQTTNSLAQQLQEEIEQGLSRASLYQSLQKYPFLWGSALLKNGTPYLWDGFSLEQIPDGNTDALESPKLQVLRENNVIFWMADRNFSVQQDSNRTAEYRLLISSRIIQENNLPIGKNSEFNLFSQQKGQPDQQVAYSFFNPLPASVNNYRVLHSTNGDSIGVVYASKNTANTLQDPLQEWNKGNWFWMFVLAIISFICIAFVLALGVESFPAWLALSLQLLLIAAGWIVFHWLHIPSRWLPALVGQNQELLHNYNILSAFAVDSIFLFLLAVAMANKIRRQTLFYKSSWFLATILIAIIVGAGNILAILSILYKVYNVTVHSGIGLLDLNVLPSFATLFYSLSLGLILFSMMLALVSINYFVIRSARDHQKLLSSVIIIGGVLSLLIAQLFVPEIIRLNWAFWLCIILFSAVYMLSHIYFNHPKAVNNISALRAIAISSLFIAAIATPIFYVTHITNQDSKMEVMAKDFYRNSNQYAKQLTLRVLTQLEQKLQGLTSKKLVEETSSIQAEFTQTIQQLITDNTENYSLDLRLINPEGSVISDYSTTLNSPAWVSRFDIQQLVSSTLEIQRITKSTNRPVGQEPQLIDEQNYKSFYRGWIAIFGENTDTPIAWILCSVYKEKPDFDKPIRAVMASLTYDDWKNSYLMLEYEDKNLVRSERQGISASFPEYQVLRPGEAEAVDRDSLLFYNSSDRQNYYRTLLWKAGDKKVEKIISLRPSFRNLLFTAFRLNFILLIAASFLCMLIHLSGLHKFSFLAKSHKFRHRIMDTFLLAALIFLMLLVITTHYAIKKQNEEIVRQELTDKLENLSQATEVNASFITDQNLDNTNLNTLVTPFNVDAFLFSKFKVVQSTTPQIFQQHLLPMALPYTVYTTLFSDYKRNALESVTLAAQKLLIGYRSLLSEQGRPIAVIAIPTFIQSPKYDQQLLQTTSYLIILYLIIFGLFIGGTALLSNRLTRPLRLIQAGLNKISEGRLDTTIPITSKDEIGNLAGAYNQMVHRLKELQEELAIAEREAAWKEMAQQVAHEIKNPLTPMKLNIQHLERQLASNQYSPEELKPRILKITENIIQQIQSLNKIASDFSNFSKPIESEFKVLSLNKIITSVGELYQHDETIDICTQLPDKELYIEGAKDELSRVFINLVKNAFEAMPEGGTINLRLYTKAESIFVEVEDNGKGISEKDKAKIFVPNFSTKSSGTGLGLAISKKTIEEHGGTISFASIEGDGTTFIIKLPPAKKDAT